MERISDKRLAELAGKHGSLRPGKDQLVQELAIEIQALRGTIKRLSAPVSVHQIRSIYGDEVSDDWVQNHIGFFAVIMSYRLNVPADGDGGAE